MSTMVRFMFFFLVLPGHDCGGTHKSSWKIARTCDREALSRHRLGSAAWLIHDENGARARSTRLPSDAHWDDDN